MKRAASRSAKTETVVAPSPAPQVSPAVTQTNARQPELAPTPAPSVAPEPVVRIASTAAGGGSLRRDLPYAVPIANKAGFVTSPYAPRAGIVDVRGFPSGTEVKDPYTGRVFLTP